MFIIKVVLILNHPGDCLSGNPLPARLPISTPPAPAIQHEYYCEPLEQEYSGVSRDEMPETRPRKFQTKSAAGVKTGGTH